MARNFLGFALLASLLPFLLRLLRVVAKQQV